MQQDFQIEIVHENEKSYKCETCEKSFGIKKNLKRHVRMIHENLKVYRCESCDRSFGQKDSLKNHVNVVHEKNQSIQM